MFVKTEFTCCLFIFITLKTTDVNLPNFFVTLIIV